MFSKKTPMEKWRSRNRVGAAFVNHSGWSVHLESGAVHTMIDGVPVTVLLSAESIHIGVIIEAGAQAERTLANVIGDDGGEPFTFEGWHGAAAPGSGLLEGGDRGGSGGEFHDKVMAAAHDLVARIRRT